MEPELIIRGDRHMCHSVKERSHRKQFFDDLAHMGDLEFFEKYFFETPRVKLESVLRRMAARTGLYQSVRRIYRKLLKDR
jgi:hypothetical protein